MDTFGEVMIQRVFPQEEQRMYVTEERYLLKLYRRGSARANNMPLSDYARNIWLMEGEDEIWRVHSYSDATGNPFTWLNTTYSEYVAGREGDDDAFRNRWLLNMETGEATPYPPTRDWFAGPELQLYVKTEMRIYFADGSYIVLTFIPTRSNPRNITRISATGKEMWRISTGPKWDSDPRYNFFGWLTIYDDGTYVAELDDRMSVAIDIETGKATWR